MSVQQPPPLHTVLGVNGHAHPSSTAATTSRFDAEKQSLEELLAGLAIHVEVRGLAFGSHSSPQKMYIPRLRKSENRSHPISHLDDISCWKGMSNAQALELARWESLFQQCLTSHIKSCLRRSIMVQIKVLDEYTLVPYLLQSIPKQHIRFIDIDVQDLVRGMIDALYDHRPGETAARNFRWSHGSEDLANFVYNFVYTHDCFRETPAGPCLYVQYTLDWTEYPCLSAVVHVASHPPMVQFCNVPVQIASMGQYVIAPKLVPVLSRLGTGSYQHYTGEVVYTVKKSSSMIQWDPKGGMFRAQAPDNTEKTSPEFCETLIEARNVVKFPEGVRFECVSRYTIKIDIVTSSQNAVALDPISPEASISKTPKVPLYTNTSKKPWVPSYTNTPLSKTRRRKRVLIGDLTHRSAWRKVNEQQSLIANKDMKPENPANDTPLMVWKNMKHTNLVDDAFFNDVINSDNWFQIGSPKKRKSSLSEATTIFNEASTEKTETGFKRQKLDGLEGRASETSTLPAEHKPIEPQPTTAVIHKVAQRSPPKSHDFSFTVPSPEPSQLRETINDILAKYRITHSPTSSAPYPQSQPSPSADAEEITFAPIRYITPNTLPQTSSPEVSPTSQPTAPQFAAARTTSPLLPTTDDYVRNSFRAHTWSVAAALAQEQIQNNYREFEEWAERKRCEGLTEWNVGDMEFERVFWDDSEEGTDWGESYMDTDALSEEVSALDLDAEG
ncbi:hypothetical protein Ptr902_02525 [Pyrenophora tritici-repentis]|nr:hypothetical protein Ptr902_02525 [Pyrenophora tritici-repentis]